MKVTEIKKQAVSKFQRSYGVELVSAKDIREYLLYRVHPFNHQVKQDLAVSGNSLSFWEAVIRWTASPQEELEAYMEAQAEEVAPEYDTAVEEDCGDWQPPACESEVQGDTEQEPLVTSTDVQTVPVEEAILIDLGKDAAKTLLESFKSASFVEESPVTSVVCHGRPMILLLTAIAVLIFSIYHTCKPLVLFLWGLWLTQIQKPLQNYYKGFIEMLDGLQEAWEAYEEEQLDNNSFDLWYSQVADLMTEK